MRRAEPLLLVGLTVLCLVLGILLVRASTATKREQVAAQTATRALEMEKARVQRLNGRVATLESARSAQLAKSNRSAAGGAAAAGDAGAAGKKGNESIDLTPFMKADPEWAAVHQAGLMKRVARQYGDLSRLNLAPEQLAKLQHLLADRMDAPDEARDVAVQQGMDPNGPEIGKAMQAAQEDINREIKSLVSDAEFKEIERTAYANNRMISYRNQLENTVAGDMLAAGVSPLNSQQVDQLAQIKAQIAQDLSLQKNAEGARQAELTQAAAVLSGDQLTAYQQSLENQAKISAIQSRAIQAAKKQYGGDIHSWSWRSP